MFYNDVIENNWTPIILSIIDHKA